jgi:hypothetical protein
MKKKIIKINDISQIDTSKVSIFDFNNRYIDSNGNIYGLKHNTISKKVEIIKLRRYGTGESAIFQQVASRNRSMDIHSDHLDQEFIEAEDNDAAAVEEERPYDPERFVESVIAHAETHKARLLAIIKNVDDSSIFVKEDKSELNEFNDIVRSLEIDGVQQLDRLEAYYKELTSYPRTITYYQAKMDNLQKRIFEQIAADKEQAMRFVYYYEMSATISRIYGNLKKYTSQLNDLTAEKNFDEKLNATKYQKQSFFDARISIENTLNDIDQILKDNNDLHAFATNVHNFK